MGNDTNSDFIKKNWDDKIDEMERLLHTWGKRDLTLLGKVLVVKSLAVSKIVLCTSLLPVRQHFIDKLNRIIFKFVWGKRDKVSRK